MPPADISTTKVKLTMMNGNVTYSTQEPAELTESGQFCMHLRTRGSPLLAHTVLSFVAALVFLIFTSYTSGQSATDSESAVLSETSGESSEDLLKAAENPVADLCSIPIQNTTNFNIGPYRRTHNIVTLEPVIPLSLSENWMLVSRIIQPIIWQPYPDQKAGGVLG
ncbi:MAG: hypothetical protein WBQ89_11260 [Candidatus Acidiferrum sp.]